MYDASHREERSGGTGERVEVILLKAQHHKQKFEFKISKFETRNLKFEIRNSKLKIRS